AQGDDCQYYGHAGAGDGPVEPVEKEQKADPKVEGSFNMQIMNAGGNDLRLLRGHEYLHQRFCKETHKKADEKAEDKGAQKSALHTLPDPVFFFCSIILGDKGGKCISKVLYRHVGKGVDLHRCRKS